MPIQLVGFANSFLPPTCGFAVTIIGLGAPWGFCHYYSYSGCLADLVTSLADLEVQFLAFVLGSRTSFGFMSKIPWWNILWCDIEVTFLMGSIWYTYSRHFPAKDAAAALRARTSTLFVSFFCFPEPQLCESAHLTNESSIEPNSYCTTCATNHYSRTTPSSTRFLYAFASPPNRPFVSCSKLSAWLGSMFLRQFWLHGGLIAQASLPCYTASPVLVFCHSVLKDSIVLRVTLPFPIARNLASTQQASWCSSFSPECRGCSSHIVFTKHVVFCSNVQNSEEHFTLQQISPPTSSKPKLWCIAPLVPWSCGFPWAEDFPLRNWPIGYFLHCKQIQLVNGIVKMEKRPLAPQCCIEHLEESPPEPQVC